MDNKLLVRTYDVGFGDCIYVRIPDGDDYFHMLIDCGTSDPAEPLLKNVVENVLSMLPIESGKRRLNLLVVTHPHADHIKGFNPDWFEDVSIDRIWLPVFLKQDHPQAKKMIAFQNLANNAAMALQSRGLNLAPGMQEMLSRSIWNPGALKALREGLAQSSGIHPSYPLYVARDLADRLSKQELKEYKLDFDNGTTCFRGFEDQKTCVRVLAPEWDIDKYYLGEGTSDSHSLIDLYLLDTEAYKAGSDTISGSPFLAFDDFQARSAAKSRKPRNISASDFRRLQNRLLYSALAFSEKDDRLKNNTSVVLLLEWRGCRLLFTGDAEWQGTGVQEGRRNSAWDVMLHFPDVRQVLLQPLDFLKVAHHGSHNGTPFHKRGKEDILPKMVFPDRTKVVVSTIYGQHGEKNPVPFPPLMKELGQLAANSRKYPNDQEVDLRNVYQPQRTDLEAPVAGEELRYIQVTVSPNNS
jgi:beta-lactamase superfamily II metal-dependent hydrolase